MKILVELPPTSKYLLWISRAIDPLRSAVRYALRGRTRRVHRDAAREVLVAFLSTAEGEGRHARRNDKTLQVEAAHLRTRQLARTFDEGRG